MSLLNIAINSNQIIGNDNQIIEKLKSKQLTNNTTTQLKEWQKNTINAAFVTVSFLAVMDIWAIITVFKSSSVASTNELTTLVLLTITIILNFFTLKYKLDDSNFHSINLMFTLTTTLVLYVCESRALFVFTLSGITSIVFITIFYWFAETYAHPKVRLYKLARQRNN